MSGQEFGLSELLEFGVIVTTIPLTVVTGLAAYPYEVLQAHKRKLINVSRTVAGTTVRVGANLLYLGRYHGKLAIVRLAHHGRWIWWQISTRFPSRYRR